jgi:hypothetical protein
MLFSRSEEGIKAAFSLVTKLPFTKSIIHRLSETVRGKGIAYFSVHRILPKTKEFLRHPDVLSLRSVFQEELYRSLKQLKRTLNFISLADSLDRLSGQRRIDSSAAVLLLEVPYNLSIKCLMPIIEELSIPLSIMLASKSIESGEMLWMDEVNFRILNSKSTELSLKFLDRSFPLRSDAERMTAAHHVINSLSHCAPKLLRTRLMQLREQSKDEALAPLSERIASQQELKKLAAKSLISFISAGSFHAPFYSMSPDEAKKEIFSAKEELSSLFQDAFVPVYCYPIGFDKVLKKHFLKMLSEAGFKAAISRLPGINRPGDNLFCLTRLPLVHGAKSLAQFELQGLSEAIEEFLLVTLAKDKEL